MQNEKKEDHCWFFIGPFIHEGICMCSNYYIINGKKTLISVVTNSAETYKNNKNMSYLGVGEYDSTVQCISCAPQNYPLYQKSLEQQRYNEIEKSVGKADASRLFLMEQFYAPSMSSYPFSMELYPSVLGKYSSFNLYPDNYIETGNNEYLHNSQSTNFCSYCEDDFFFKEELNI